MPSKATLVPDVSHWQGAHSASDLRQAAKVISGIMFKASDGASYDDPVFRSNVAAAEAANLHWGAYIFTEAGAAGPQVSNFVQDVRSAPGSPSFLLIDWERGERSTAAGILRGVKQALNVPVLSYLGAWARAHGGELGIEDGAMVPSYGPSSLASAYKPHHVPLVAWQYTDGKYNGTKNPSSIPGIGACDCSIVYVPRLMGLDQKKEDQLSAQEKKELQDLRAFVDPIRKALGDGKATAPAGAAGRRVASAVKKVEKQAKP